MKHAVKLVVLLALIVVTSWMPSSARAVAVNGRGPTLTSLGPLVFSADGTLFAADNAAAAVYALDLGAQASKNGADFLLMSNTRRGVMNISTRDVATAAPITEPVLTPTGGVPYETVAAMTGIEQMDLLDAQHSIVVARAATGINLQVVPLP